MHAHDTTLIRWEFVNSKRWYSHRCKSMVALRSSDCNSFSEALCSSCEKYSTKYYLSWMVFSTVLRDIMNIIRDINLTLILAKRYKISKRQNTVSGAFGFAPLSTVMYYLDHFRHKLAWNRKFELVRTCRNHTRTSQLLFKNASMQNLQRHKRFIMKCRTR